MSLARVLYARISHLGPAGSIDKQRIRRRYGQVSAAELEAIDRGLCLYLGLALSVLRLSPGGGAASTGK